MCFAGVKATGRQYERPPDTVMASKPDCQNGDIQHLQVVSEVKIPCVEEHKMWLSDRMIAFDTYSGSRLDQKRQPD
ncbi:hypothetical protein N7519_006421 [Penicillium mononematosum]|uniref:uncharacterized protein n=1 Tax=Penicillium mononematosum TaxID=268346 RepID=UPI0025492737|nr:uncharacterized protein N7519_006421 [Penicillium mononematosum]KAJ6185120.1 hypothetical protein N7519_006421 [Penicillium mononematosum]